MKVTKDVVKVSLKGWNYRMIRKYDDNNEPYMDIHEVFYGEDGKPHSWTVDPIAPRGETARDVYEDLILMKKSFQKPILEVEERDGEKYLVEAKNQSKIK